MNPDIRQHRTDARASLEALRLPPAEDSELRRRLKAASADDLPGILAEAHRLDADRNRRLREKYSSLLTEARAGFLEDTGIAVRIAEDARAIQDHERTRTDPEAVKADAIRLRSQGAGLDELQRTLRTNREQIIEWIKDAPEKPSAPVSAPVMDARDRMPEPRPVIPSKKLKTWTPKPITEDDPRHGSNAGYMHGCRCEPCTTARKAYRAERKANPPKPRATNSEHGTNSRYTKGCRCDDCRAAATAWARDYRERKAKKNLPTTLDERDSEPYKNDSKHQADVGVSRH